MEHSYVIENDEILRKLPPCLRELVKQLWMNSHIGAITQNILVKVFGEKITHTEIKPQYINRILLEIPYTNKYLKWEVIFDEEDYGLPPEFYLKDEVFSNTITNTDLKAFIPSLGKWDINNPKALISIVKEFFQLYRMYQIQKLHEDEIYSNLSKEYAALLTETNLTENDVDVFIDPLNGSITFHIPLVIDFSSLPVYLQPDLPPEGRFLNSLEDIAILTLVFSNPNSGRVQVHLQLSPRLEQVLGNANMLHIPYYSKDKGFVNYFNIIKELLMERVKNIQLTHKKKVEFVTALLDQGANVVEYDSSQFSKATVMCEVDGFYCLVTFLLGNDFPNKEPTVILRSLYHMNEGKPYQTILTSYPYSPRWTPEEMVQKLFEKLHIALPFFKTESQEFVRNQMSGTNI